MSNGVSRFKDDYDFDNVIGKRYKSKIMGGEVYLVMGYDNRRKNSTGIEIIVGIRGRTSLFMINLRDCMLYMRV